MSGIVFFRSERRDEIAEFYVERVGFERWLEQDGGCSILQFDNLLVGFCDAGESETGGMVTVVLEDEAAVDDLYGELADVARGPPEVNEEFNIYQFFAEDPDGRMVEVQAFLHPTPDVSASR